MENKSLIKLNDVTVKFKEHLVLDKVCMEFESGKIYGIIGRNGSGKTVLLKCVCGLMDTTDGTVSVNGKIVGKDVDFPENIGFIIENPGFLPHYSGFKNLKYLASIRGTITDDDIRRCIRTVDEWIHKYGVRYFSELTNMAVLTEEVGELARIIGKYREETAYFFINLPAFGT